MTLFPTSHGEECPDREPDMTLQQFYTLLLRALALENRDEFNRLSTSYLVGNRGAYLIREKRKKQD